MKTIKKTIIAPTDFTTPSLNAVNYALGLASSIDADLVLLHVLPVPIMTPEAPLPETVFEDMIRSANEDLDDLAKKLAIRIKGRISISKEILIGTVERQIEALCEEKEPFAVVMGIKEGADLEKFFVGSHAVSAARHLHYPILIVPEHASFSGIGKIAVACDLEEVKETVPFDELNELLTTFFAELHVIHISKDKNEKSSPDIESSLSLQNRLSKFKPQFHFLHAKEIEGGINEFAKKQGFDLLVIIPKKHGILETLDKKFSKKIISHTQIPVMSIHSAEN